MQQCQDDDLGSVVVAHVRIESGNLFGSTVALLLSIELLVEKVIAPFVQNLSSIVRVRDGRAVVWHHLSAALEELVHSDLDVLRRFHELAEWLEAISNML